MGARGVVWGPSRPVSRHLECAPAACPLVPASSLVLTVPSALAASGSQEIGALRALGDSRGRQRLQDTSTRVPSFSRRNWTDSCLSRPGGPPCSCWATWPGDCCPRGFQGSVLRAFPGDTVTLLQSEPAIKEWLEGCESSLRRTSSRGSLSPGSCGLPAQTCAALALL